MIERDIIVM